MKQYGLYNIKEYEQCEYFGTQREIATYLGLSYRYIGSYLTRKKKGTQELLKRKYDLVEITNEETEEMSQNQYKKRFEKKSLEYKRLKDKCKQKIIWQDILKTFGYIDSTPEEEIAKFKIFDEFNWYIKGLANQVIYDEEWKQIPGFTYSLSNWGRVRNDKNGKIKSLRYHRWAIQTDIYKDGKRFTIDVPRLEAHLFIRFVKENERVTYIDGDRRNNYYKNLKIVSK